MKHILRPWEKNYRSINITDTSGNGHFRNCMGFYNYSDSLVYNASAAPAGTRRCGFISIPTANLDPWDWPQITFSFPTTLPDSWLKKILDLVAEKLGYELE